MRKAISIVLAALLIILPVEQVLAQAAQQEAVSVQQTVPSDGAAHLFRVSPVTQNSARLLRTPSERALVPEFLALPMTNPVDALLPTPAVHNPGVDELAPMPLPPTGTITIIVVGVLLVIAAIVIVRSGAS